MVAFTASSSFLLAIMAFQVAQPALAADSYGVVADSSSARTQTAYSTSMLNPSKYTAVESMSTASAAKASSPSMSMMSPSRMSSVSATNATMSRSSSSAPSSSLKPASSMPITVSVVSGVAKSTGMVSSSPKPSASGTVSGVKPSSSTTKPAMFTGAATRLNIVEGLGAIALSLGAMAFF